MRALLGGLAVAGMLAAASAAGAQTWTTTLAAAGEGNASPGTGTSSVELDTAAHSLRVVAEFSGLEAATTAAHIHGPTAEPGAGNAGVMTMTPSFADFPAGVSEGAYDMTFDTSDAATYNPAFVEAAGGSVEAAEAALAAALAAGTTYLNIHTEAHPGGEIRGFFPAQ